jgi:hypothetical protein
MAADWLLLSRVPVDGSSVSASAGPAAVRPGIGAVFAAGPIATHAGVAEEEAGLASGLSDMSSHIGAALGVAVVLTTVVSQADGHGGLVALRDGFQAAFARTIAFAAAGVVIVMLLLGRGPARRNPRRLPRKTETCPATPGPSPRTLSTMLQGGNSE